MVLIAERTGLEVRGEYKSTSMTLKEVDNEIYSAVRGEQERQQDELNLIPSENYVSAAVLEALGSVFTNKYAEGYPGDRYYGGQTFTDTIEQIAIDRAKSIFSAQYVNVQPLSGAPANLAVYAALLEPGDTVLGMDLSHGGHLTHGHPATFPAHVFDFRRYGMADIDTGEIDCDALYKTAKKVKPEIILAGFSSYPRTLDYEKFVEIARSVDAYAVMDAAHIAGLIAGGAMENPLDAGFDVMTCTTHKTLRGPRGGMILTRERQDIAKKIDKAVFPGLQGGPHMNAVAAKAVCLKEVASPEFTQYASDVLENAKEMAAVFSQKSVKMITGGTSNHLMLIDTVRSFGLSGKEAEEILESVGIIVNKNVIPDDSRSPKNPSGIRLGTPALTTRGFGTRDCARVAELINIVLSDYEDDTTLHRAKKEVKELVRSHPVPGIDA